jgi:hypothetical protein
MYLPLLLGLLAPDKLHATTSATYLTPGPRNIILVSVAELKLRWAPWTSMQAIRS